MSAQQRKVREELWAKYQAKADEYRRYLAAAGRDCPRELYSEAIARVASRRAQ